MTPEERFWARVDASGDCWLWMSGRNGNGYGVTYARGRSRPTVAHRWAWESLVGPIPKGLYLDHLCRVRRCVNPDHLDVVTNRENLVRGYGIIGRNARATRCSRGHEYTPENTVLNRNNCRDCRICKVARNAAYVARNKPARAA